MLYVFLSSLFIEPSISYYKNKNEIIDLVNNQVITTSVLIQQVNYIKYVLEIHKNYELHSILNDYALILIIEEELGNKAMLATMDLLGNNK